jgi:diacylglycerol kinase family enzyme
MRPEDRLRILLIVNSFASSVTARTTVLVQQALEEGNEVQLVETNRRGHATRFAQDAAKRGIDVVAALGGDGTLNEAANGIARTACALAPLPGGSTNVFARTLGLPNDPVASAAIIATAIAERRIERVGLGSVNGRYFCFHTGIGFDAAVVRAVEKRDTMKRWLGHPLFMWAALTTWGRRYDRKRPHFAVRFPDGSELTEGYFTLVMNSDPYTFLGNRPLSLAPEATLDRGLVAITFRSLHLATMARALTGIWRGRGVGEHSAVDKRTDLSGLDVVAERPFPYQVDGDDLGDTRRLVFRHEPDAIGLVVPAR